MASPFREFSASDEPIELATVVLRNLPDIDNNAACQGVFDKSAGHLHLHAVREAGVMSAKAVVRLSAAAIPLDRLG